MRTGDFDFELPAELIAQQPAPQRDASRLLVLHRASGRIEHRQFRDLPDYLGPGDVLALNDTRVIPARLRGRNARTAGQFEVLLLSENAVNDWWVMLRPGKRARAGTRILFCDASGQPSQAQAEVTGTSEEGHRRLRFSGVPNIAGWLDSLGEVPLPPYIRRGGPSAPSLSAQDRERYQTVYAGPRGSVAAPTAGLHFTAALLDDLRARGVQVCFLTLHVGLGTFAPVKTESLAAHVMHEERFVLSEETARLINEAKEASKPARRVVAVGTTTMRVLESVAALHQGRLVAGAGATRIFIYPPYDFKIADVLLTNFHLPRSTLVMLASAFAAPGETRGTDLLRNAYAEAIRERYRFFSYGDAMLLL
jgi:S-adenosylmethionine:tRNA ribosyltransferase-isomerase